MQKIILKCCCAVFVFGGLMTSTTVLAATSSVSSFQTPLEIEAKVRADFADIPVMIDIARCESKFRQFTDAGNAFRGGAGGQMIGVFQFFESIHTAPARLLGYDLATVEGNLGYARHLYNLQGTTPWRSCVPAVTPVSSDAIVQQRLAIMRQLIPLLQQLLALKLAEEGR